MRKFEEKIYNYIADEYMLQKGDKLLLGVSGGADSVCLLRAMTELAEVLDLSKQMVVVHVNHMIRGEEANRDEEFTRSLCEKYGHIFVGYREDIPAMAAALGISCEEAGRKFRYEKFEENCIKYGCNKIAVAHNENDLAETVIFNMIRGSGIAGLSGIDSHRDNIVRPLMCAKRMEIEAYLEELSQDYCTDSTNNTLDYTRNKIRHIILPAMEEINQAAVEHISMMSGDAGLADSYIEAEANKQLSVCGNYDEIHNSFAVDIEKLKRLPLVLISRMLHNAVARVAGRRKDITRRHIDSVCALIYQESGKSVRLPYEVVVRRSYDRLVIEKIKNEDENEYNIEIGTSGIYELPNNGMIKVVVRDVEKSYETIIHDGKTEVNKKDYETENMYIENSDNSNLYKKNLYTKIADYGKIKGRLCIRTPMEGDYIVINAEGKTKKLNRVFIDAKVDRLKRKSWPVVACGSEVIWAVGLRYNEAYRITADTKQVISFCYEHKEND